MAKIILFAKQNFEGDSTVVLTDSSPGLRGSGVNNDVSSIIVIDGAWNLFVHPDYEGGNWVVSSTGGPNGDGTGPGHHKLKHVGGGFDPAHPDDWQLGSAGHLVDHPDR